MIIAYCDGSYNCSSKVGVATAILLTDTHYIKTLTKIYENLESQMDIEIYGILQALEASKSTKDRHIHIYCDAIFEVNRANKIISKGYVPNHIKPNDLWTRFLELSKDMIVEVSHTRGHSIDMNPNKLCDYMSNTLVRKVSI